MAPFLQTPLTSTVRLQSGASPAHEEESASRLLVLRYYALIGDFTKNISLYLQAAA